MFDPYKTQTQEAYIDELSHKAYKNAPSVAIGFQFSHKYTLVSNQTRDFPLWSFIKFSTYDSSEGLENRILKFTPLVTNYLSSINTSSKLEGNNDFHFTIGGYPIREDRAILYLSYGFDSEDRLEKERLIQLNITLANIGKKLLEISKETRFYPEHCFFTKNSSMKYFGVRNDDEYLYKLDKS